DEFHSVTNTRCPSALSHFASSASCVVLPDPSMPSTTNSFPGYSCGLVRLFSICSSAHFHTEWLADEAFEGRGVPGRCPDLELGVARRPQLQQAVVAAVVELDVGDRLGVAAIEAFGQSQDR